MLGSKILRWRPVVLGVSRYSLALLHVRGLVIRGVNVDMANGVVGRAGRDSWVGAVRGRTYRVHVDMEQTIKHKEDNRAPAWGIRNALGRNMPGVGTCSQTVT